MIANSVHDAFLQTCCVALHFNAAVSLKKGLGEHKYVLTLSAILFPISHGEGNISFKFNSSVYALHFSVLFERRQDNK